MAYHITRRDLEHAHSAASQALGTIKKFRAEVLTKNTASMVLGGVTALGFGYLSGYAGAVDVGRVPVDLLTGFFLQVGALMKLAGDQSYLLHAMGNGALDSWATKKGAAMGDAMRRRQGKHIARGAFPASTGAGGRLVMGAERRPVSEAELAHMLASVRK
jgi:hypothetical protein